MLNTEIAEVLDKKNGVMYDIAEKIVYNRQLDNEEKEIFELSDAWAREIGRTGRDEKHEISQFIERTLTNDDIQNAPDELLDLIFDRGSIGEFDLVEYTRDPKNTLIAHDSAKEGTVDRSWIDFSKVHPITRNASVATDLSYADLRRNGFKSVATLTTYAKEALQNKLYFDVFDMVDKALVTGDGVVTATGGSVTPQAWKQFCTYLLDRNLAATAVTFNKYARDLYDMPGNTGYLSNEMKNDFNRYGLVKFATGVNIASISGAYHTGDGKLMLPDKRIFGIAGKIGNLDMVGDVHVYEDMDNFNEKVVIQIRDFSYNVAINKIENCAKIIISD